VFVDDDGLNPRGQLRGTTISLGLIVTAPGQGDLTHRPKPSQKLSTPLSAGLTGEKRARAVFFTKGYAGLNYNSTHLTFQEPTSPVALYACEDFTVRFSVRQNFLLKQLVTDTDNNGVVSTELVNCRNLESMTLSDAACRMRDLPNAGGNSVISEVLSFEVLQKCFGAQLLKTEMEVSYWPEGGSITDYVCQMFNTTLGVSVTRAMNFRSNFTEEEAQRLLSKKLNGIIQSSRNSLDQWSKQILHVWAASRHIADITASTFHALPSFLRSNTLLLITVANYRDIFENR